MIVYYILFGHIFQCNSANVFYDAVIITSSPYTNIRSVFFVFLLTPISIHVTLKKGREPLSKKGAKAINNIEHTIDKLRPIDDTFFHKLVERKEFCEELLQIILKKPDLKVIENIPQRSLRNVDGRSVTVDVLCKDSTGKYYNAEVQKSDNDDHQKRVRYNGSNMDTFISEKGTKFMDLPDVYMIYISSFDLFNEGKTIYHVNRVLQETGTVINNGFHEIYVNTQVDDETDIADLMKIFNNFSVPDDKRFENICSSIRYYKKGKGRDNMCDVVEEYAREYATEQKKSIALEMMQSDYTDEQIHKLLKFSYEEIEQLRKTADCLS